MQFKTISSLALALASMASAIPVAEPATLHKRDECVFYGEWIVDITIGGGGPGQSPVSSSTGYMWIEYMGGVSISPNLNGDPITEVHQNFSPSQTRLPSEITWYAAWDFGYSSCTVVYEGVTYTGGANPHPFNPPSNGDAWQCQVNFGCEGGISPL